MNNYRALKVRNEATVLQDKRYSIIAEFPSSERFGLADRMTRSAVSVPSKIAEGAARNSQVQSLRYLSAASDPIAELNTQVDISRRLKFSPRNFEALLAKSERTHKMIDKLQAGAMSSIANAK